MQHSNLSKVAVLGAICLAATGLLMHPAIDAATPEGKWVVPASPQTACPSIGGTTTGCDVGTVCSEWDVDGDRVTACCIPAAALGSSDPGACLGFTL